MDSNTLNRFRILLETERQRILSNSSAALVEMADKIPETSGDEGDEAQNLAAMHLNMRFRERERAMLDKIGAALERMKEGSYGECDDCGGVIGIRRLEIRPITTLCIACKEGEEKREKEFAQR